MNESTNIDPDNILNSNTKIIKNPLFLTTAYAPPIIKERDAQIRSAKIILRESLRREEYPTFGLINGPPGVGKTLIITHVLDKFIEESALIGKIYQYVIIDCNEKPRTLTEIYRKILRSIDNSIQYDIKTTKECQDKIISSLQISKANLIIVLDNIDALEDRPWLYDFTWNWQKELRSLPIYVSFLAISRKPILTITDPITKSIIDLTYVGFPQYTKEELESILYDRLDAFFDGSIDKMVISMAAKYTLQKTGDVTQAIDLLRESAQYAESLNKSILTVNCMETVIDRREKLPSEQTSKAWTRARTQVFLAMLMWRKHSWTYDFSNHGFYEFYCNFCSENNIYPVNESRLSIIISELATNKIITARKDLRSKKGNYRLIHILLNNEEILQFLNDVIKSGSYDSVVISCLREDIFVI